MDIRIQAIHFHADNKLTATVEKKVAKLTDYYDRITSAEVFLKLDHEGAHFKDKVVQIKLNLPKSTLIAKETAKTFEDSLDRAVDALKSQVVKHKEKLRN